MKQLVLASNNPGKIREIRAILAPLDTQSLTSGNCSETSPSEPAARG